MLEHLKEEDVDRDFAVVEVTDDPLGGVVELGGDKHDLVRLVERFLIEIRAESLLEGGCETPTCGETSVDLCNPVDSEVFDPRSIGAVGISLESPEFPSH